MLARDEISLNAFESWLEPYVWDMESDSEPDALELVYSIQLLFSERNNQRLDKKELRAHLVAFVNNAVISVRFDLDLRPVAVPSLALSEVSIFASPHPQSQAFALQPA